MEEDMKRKAVVFYRNFYEAIDKLPSDIQLELYRAIIKYGLDGENPENLSTIAECVFELVRPSIDANNAKYVNGKKGGRGHKRINESESETLNQESELNQTETKKEPEQNQTKTSYIYDNVNDNDNNTSESESLMLVPPQEKVPSFETIVQRFNTRLSPPLPKVQVLSDARKNLIRGILNKHGTEAIDIAFQKVLESKLLRGEVGNGWRCTFDWLFNARNFIKVLEGNYDKCYEDRPNGKTNSSTTHGEACDAVLEEFAATYAAKQGMVNEVGKPF